MSLFQNDVQQLAVNLRELVAKKRAYFNNNSPEIHRITTATAFRKLGGGEDLPVDFDVRDLVIVHGSTGCSKGVVRFSIHDSTVRFSLERVEHCTHWTEQLCVRVYSASYGILKDVALASEIDSHQVKVKVHTGVPSSSEIHKSNLLRQLQNRDAKLTELVLDHDEGGIDYSVADIRAITLALGSLSPTLERVVMTEEFCLKAIDWSEDWECLEKLVPLLWAAAAQLPLVKDLRFHCPIGQLVSVPMLSYLRNLSDVENLRRLELNVGGDLIENMASRRDWQHGRIISLRVKKEIEELVNIVGRGVNLETLLLRWRLTNADGVAKVQQTLSELTNTLSHLKQLTSLHLESFVYVSLGIPFFTTSTLRTICQMGNLHKLKIAGMQLTDECAVVFAEELLQNTALKTISFWIPNDKRDCKRSDFTKLGLMEIRSMMEQQLYITSFCVEHLDEDEYNYWSGKCDSDVISNDSNTITEREVRKYLQAKIESCCRLNAVGRRRILQDQNASQNDYIDLLSVVNNDLDAVFSTLLQNPLMLSC